MFEFLKKRDYAATLEPGGAALRVKGGQRLLTAALEAGFAWPHDCRVGSCGTCRCVLKRGRIKALTDFVYTLDPADIRAGAILACQTLLKSDVVVEIELGAGAAALEEVCGTISGQRHLTHDIVEVTVSLERPSFITARAGQYVDISSTQLAAPRSYSLAHAPNHGDGRHCAFFVRHVRGGEFTDWLFAANRCGEGLILRGPCGNFHRREGSGRMICIAGGSGLAPINALLEDAVRVGETRACVVLFGAREMRDLYYLDELAELGRRWGGPFSLWPVLSGEPTDSAWTGARGMVTDDLTKAVGIERFDARDQAYACGPPAMIDAAITRLQSMGLATSAIYFDRFLDASTQAGGRGALR